jgi:hypothetical protein
MTCTTVALHLIATKDIGQEVRVFLKHESRTVLMQCMVIHPKGEFSPTLTVRKRVNAQPQLSADLCPARNECRTENNMIRQVT